MKRHDFWLALLVAAVVLALFPADSRAQRTGASDLDILDRERANRPPEPRSRPDIAVTEDAQGRPVYDESLRFELADLVVDGATAFTQDELLAPYRGLIGGQVSFGDVNRIALELSSKYRDAGYVLSRVVVPAQRLDAAYPRVRLRVLEGYIESFRWVGEPGQVRKAAAWFSGQAARLQSQRPLQYRDFERAISIMSGIVGAEVSTSFTPGTRPEASVVVIELSVKPIDGRLSLNNTSTPSSGPWIAGLDLGLSTMPLFGSRFDFSYNQALDILEYYSAYLSLGHKWASGWSLSASFGFSESLEPDSEFAALFEQSNRSRTFTVGAGYDLLRSRQKNLGLEMLYTQRDSVGFLLGDRHSTDHTRSLTWRVNFDFADEGGGVTQIIPSFVQGLDAFGATDRDPLSSSPMAPATYSKGGLYLSHARTLAGGLGFFAAAQLQLAGTILPGYEEFSLGGGVFGKGYDSGTLESDNGLGASFELRWSRQLTGALSLQPYAFIDWGTVWTKGTIPGVDPHEDLSSAGAGLRVWARPERLFPRSLSLDAFVGKPLKTVYRNSSPRWIMMLSATF